MLSWSFFLIVIVNIIIVSSKNTCRNCVLPLMYWKTHNAFESDPHRKLTWPHSCSTTGSTSELNIFFNTQIAWLDFINIQNEPDEVCVPAGKEYIAAMLNKCSGACLDPLILGYISDISRLLSDLCPGGRHYKNGTYEELLALGHLTTSLSRFNRGSSEMRQCVKTEATDCNENGIVDKCEIDKPPFNTICIKTRGDYVVASDAKWCMHGGVSEDQFCKAFLNSKEEDCNKNHVLDSCELASKSNISCTSALCIGHQSIERTPFECLTCRSYDENMNGKIDSCENVKDAQIFGLPQILDCNENGVDDFGDIVSGFSNDTDKNFVPDECQFGTCCSGFSCDRGSLKECPSTFDPKACHLREDCKPPIHEKLFGSCCKRTSAVNPGTKCTDGVDYDSCLEARGSFSISMCDARNCSSIIGSCCSSNFTGACLENVPLGFCNTVFEASVFDTASCTENCLCNSNFTTIGSCVSNNTCEDKVARGICQRSKDFFFDLIPCKHRMDLYEPRLGSCCLRNSECQDGLSDVYCDNIGGFFSSFKCYENDWCDTRKSGSCCLNNETCFSNKEGSCRIFGKDFIEIECNESANCTEFIKINKGCCYINEMCTTEKTREECEFFNGVFAPYQECQTDPKCEQGLKIVEHLRKAEEKSENERELKRIKSIIKNEETKTIIENIQKPEKMTIQQVLVTTVFSVTFGVLIVGWVLAMFIRLTSQ